MGQLKKYLVVAIIVLLGISVLAGVQVLSASSKHFYAGYYYYNSEGWPPPHGVKGDIYN